MAKWEVGLEGKQMSKTWPRIFRDPIHNQYAFYNTAWDRLLLELIDTREVQRLHRIKQLGFSELVFPSANHSRFAHSLGVLHLSRKFLDQFDLLSGKRLDDWQRCLILAAALLHDLGHGPFSHAFEQITGTKHEFFTREIILDPDTQVHQRLREFDETFPRAVAGLFDEKVATSDLPVELPPYLTQVISSQFDADRCDYLLRDSHATGTNYGEFDLQWLLSHLLVQEDGRRFYFSHKALQAVEAYLFARYHMYRTVYFHKTTRAAEVMLKLLFRRFRALLGDQPTIDAGTKLVPDAPRAVLAIAAGQLRVSWYLRIDEHAITEFLRACSEASDPVLQELGGGLLDRRLYKVIDVTEASRAQAGDFAAAVQLRLQQEPNAESLFASDTARDTPYKPYTPDERQPTEQIFVEDSSGQRQEISTLSPTVDQLRKPYELVRYYFPQRLRNDLLEIARKTLRKETP